MWATGFLPDGVLCLALSSECHHLTFHRLESDTVEGRFRDAAGEVLLPMGWTQPLWFLELMTTVQQIVLGNVLCNSHDGWMCS